MKLFTGARHRGAVVELYTEWKHFCLFFGGDTAGGTFGNPKVNAEQRLLAV